MEEIKQIILRNSKTGENIKCKSLDEFKIHFKENYDLAIKEYYNYYKKNEKSFLKALDFNFNAFSVSHFKIVKIHYISDDKKTKSVGNGQGTIYKAKKTGLYVGQYVRNGKRYSVYQKKNEKLEILRKDLMIY